jgi:hypothetical protein
VSLDVDVRVVGHVEDDREVGQVRDVLDHTAPEARSIEAYPTVRAAVEALRSG